MKLDEIEKLAKYTTDVDGFIPRINAATDLVTLARFVLRAMPLIRAVEAWGASTTDNESYALCQALDDFRDKPEQP
jgi:hypothetical protein